MNRRLILLATLFLGLAAEDGGMVGNQGLAPGIFATPLDLADLAPQADTVWLDGKQTPADSTANRQHSVLWTRSSGTSWRGLSYGAGTSLGVRHLRLAFARPIAVGSVLSLGNGRLSVLKADAPEWGDPGDDGQWIPAERLDDRSVSRSAPKPSSLTLWVLPPGCTTRALRFSHQPLATDNDLAGKQGGVYLLTGRYANLAPQGRVAVSAGRTLAAKLNDGLENGWGTWNNGETGAEQPISRERPVDLVLAFPAPVQLRGLATWACGAESIDLAGLPDARLVPGFDDAGWKPLREVGRLTDWYPATCRSSWIDLGTDAGLGAVRLRLVRTPDPSTLHPHLSKATNAGHRVWLDEVLALMPLGDRPLEEAILPPWPEATAHAPIPVSFHLDEPGRVTLIIEDKTGRRVRNLCADTPYPAGDSTAWWDGLDDLGRDTQAAAHGLYSVPGTLVAPGSYTVRGLSHPEIQLVYKFSPDDAGEPPWPTADHTGGWGTNHTPPSCAAFVPAARTALDVPLVFIGSYIAEGGHGLFWVDPEGRKRGGVGWVGGNWTGAQTLATDLGAKADPATALYVGSGFEGELRLSALNRELQAVNVLKLTLKTGVRPGGPKPEPGTIELATGVDCRQACALRDLAACDGLLVASLPAIQELWFADAAAKRLVARLPLPDPSGIAFAADGALLATSGDQLLRLSLPGLAAARASTDEAVLLTADPPTVLARGLDQPYDLGTTPAGEITVSEWGTRHQVRVLACDGAVVREVGRAGAPTLGRYDPQHLNRPAGIAADNQGRLWITEACTQPKRVGLWDGSGKLLRAWYGPSRYGGGGTLDGFDRSWFYNNGMAFRLDWRTGTLALDRILWPDGTGGVPEIPTAGGMPECPHRVGSRRFFSNWTNSNPTNGSSLVTVWEDRADALRPVAMLGTPWYWPHLATPAFAGCWPAGINTDPRYRPHLWFNWTDGDGDGAMQPGEVAMRPGTAGGITVQPDLSFVLLLDDAIVRIPATVGDGAPGWAFAAPEKLLAGAQGPASSGGGTNLLTADRRVFAYPPPLPFSKASVGSADWSYPNLWPGLHPSHEAMVPDRPGMLIGPTRLIGHDVTPRGGEAGPLVFLNQNMGNIVVFSSDGLMVATLFHDSRTAPGWRMPRRQRNMRVDHLTLGDETFWPTVTQCQDDGSIYLCTGAGSTSSLVRVDGLERTRRLPPRDLAVDLAQLERCTVWQAELERERQALNAPRRLAVPTAGPAPTVDGDLAEWAGADWAVVDERGTRANFDSNSKPYSVHASVRLAGDRLYAAWRSTERNLTANSGGQATAPFKTGAALDLMLGCDASAPVGRTKPVPGDLRLLVTTRPEGKERRTWAVLYRTVVPGTADAAKVPFSSPWRTIAFDAVADVSAEVALAQKDGDYEVSIPLAVLDLKPKAGLHLRGDLGVLRGDSGLTTQRVYWSNKATAITADVPSEAELLPGLWGTFELK